MVVDEATAGEDAEVFECESCPLAAQLDRLDSTNSQVWALYRQTVTRLAADLHAGGAVLERLTRDLSPDEFADVWRRLVVLYDTLDPPRRTEPAGE